MASTAPRTSITLRETPRANLLAYEIVAKIDKADIEWMAESVEAAFAREDIVDIILIMRDYQGAELSAVFDIEAMKSQADSVKHVRRYAVVGAPLWAKAMINLFSPVSPVEAKTFELAEEAAAWKWIGASELD